jgi:putative peptidoglycan lipid II flippase
MNIRSRIQQHWRNSDSHHYRIAAGFLWVGLFVLIGRLAGAAKEVTIAWRYGVSETVDAYVFIFNLISWPVSVWFSVLTVVLVPLYARLQHETPEELPRFWAELLGLTLLAGIVLSILVWIGLPVLLRAGWLGLSGNALSAALHMTTGMATLPLLGTLVSLFSVWLLATGHHRNTLFEAIPALTLLIAILLPSDYLSDPLLWGTLAGFALHMAALATPLYRQEKLQVPSLRQDSPAWQSFWGSIGIMAAGQILMSSTGIIDQVIASHLSPGTLSILSYTNRILVLILGVLAIAISRATLPVFSESHAKGGAELNKLALRWAKWMSLLAVGVSLIGWISAPWIVKLLFERGAFTEVDSSQVTELLRYALVQVPFYTFTITLVNLIASQKKYSVLLISGAIGLAVKILTLIILVPLLQTTGLVLSSAFVYCANGVFFYFQTKRKINGHTK